MSIVDDIQTLEPGALVELFKLDATAFGGDVVRFHKHTQIGSIWWQGNEYTPWPMQTEGFEMTSDRPPSPKLTVANLDGSITALCAEFDDLIGSIVTRYRTLGKYLDAVNFEHLRRNLVTTDSEGGLTAYYSRAGLPFVTEAEPFGDFADAIHLSNEGKTGTAYAYRQYTAPVLDRYYRFSFYIIMDDGGLPVVGTSGEPTADLTVNALGGTSPGDVQVIPVGGNIYRIVSRSRLWAGGSTATGPIQYIGQTGRGFRVSGMQIEETAGPDQTATEYQRILGVANDMNPDANPEEQLPPEIWYISRKAHEDNKIVQFELTSGMDLEGIKLPRRQIIANYCSAMSIGGYRGPYCGYTGPPVAKADDTPTTDPLLDKCSGKLSGCRLREWPDGILNFNGFPAASLTRL